MAQRSKVGHLATPALTGYIGTTDKHGRWDKFLR